VHDSRYRRIAVVLTFLPFENSGVHAPEEENDERSFFESRLPVAVESAPEIPPMDRATNSSNM
jgi:hypothetical protein